MRAGSPSPSGRRPRSRASDSGCSRAGPPDPAAPAEPSKPKPDAGKLKRELAAAETRERRAAAAVERERNAIADLDRKRSETKDRLRAAEAELRGVSLERKRLANTLDKLGNR